MAAAVLRELDASLAGFALTVARSRHTGDPADLHRAEALLAANVAEARGLAELSFEETGAYRLLLPAMSEDPVSCAASSKRRSRRSSSTTTSTRPSRPHARVVPRRRRQRGAHCRATLHPPPHDSLPPERVRELTSLDVSSTDGRERLSLGLKAMRVLGIHALNLTQERGAEAGPRATQRKDR